MINKREFSELCNVKLYPLEKALSDFTTPIFDDLRIEECEELLFQLNKLKENYCEIIKEIEEVKKWVR